MAHLMVPEHIVMSGMVKGASLQGVTARPDTMDEQNVANYIAYVRQGHIKCQPVLNIATLLLELRLGRKAFNELSGAEVGAGLAPLRDWLAVLRGDAHADGDLNVANPGAVLPLHAAWLRLHMERVKISVQGCKCGVSSSIPIFTATLRPQFCHQLCARLYFCSQILTHIFAESWRACLYSTFIRNNI